MSTVPFVDEAELRRRLPMLAAIDALEAAFRVQEPAAGPLRSHVDTPSGSLLLMPALGDAGVGVKLVTLTPRNPERGRELINAVYVLFDPATQEPEAVLDGAALTAIRTGAVSALATRFLARENSERLVILGAGVQARSHLEAMVTVRPIREVTVVSRTAEKAETLARRARELGLTSRVGNPGAISTADVVCACTSSETPVVEGALLREGTHVNAIGSYQPHTRELDTESIRRALVVVETREAALEEAGDLLIPIAEGGIDRSHIVADLQELVRGAPVRASDEDITVFKSVGLGFEDLVLARAALHRI
jgi:ornithine cyclodeaminase